MCADQDFADATLTNNDLTSREGIHVRPSLVELNLSGNQRLGSQHIRLGMRQP